MPATDIIQGTIKVVGKVHGALNTIVSLYGFEDPWFFKQFVSAEEMEKYAVDNTLAIQQQESEE